MLKPVQASSYTFQSIIQGGYLYLYIDKTQYLLDKSATEALNQIKDTEYYQKYRLKGKPLTLIGANFDSSKRKVNERKDQPDVVKA
jgi:hypothetical protein